MTGPAPTTPRLLNRTYLAIDFGFLMLFILGTQMFLNGSRNQPPTNNQIFRSWQFPIGPREVELGRVGLRSDCCLDFETGRVLTLPADLAQSYVAGNGYGATPGDTLRMHDWMRESSADVMLMLDGGLALFDGLANSSRFRCSMTTNAC